MMRPWTGLRITRPGPQLLCHQSGPTDPQKDLTTEVTPVVDLAICGLTLHSRHVRAEKKWSSFFLSSNLTMITAPTKRIYRPVLSCAFESTTGWWRRSSWRTWGKTEAMSIVHIHFLILLKQLIHSRHVEAWQPTMGMWVCKVKLVTDEPFLALIRWANPITSSHLRDNGGEEFSYFPFKSSQRYWFDLLIWAYPKNFCVYTPRRVPTISRFNAKSL